MKKLLLPIKKVYWFSNITTSYIYHITIEKNMPIILFRDQFGRNIDWENPRDLNEKSNGLLTVPTLLCGHCAQTSIVCVNS